MTKEEKRGQQEKGEERREEEKLSAIYFFSYGLLKFAFKRV